VKAHGADGKDAVLGAGVHHGAIVTRRPAMIASAVMYTCANAQRVTQGCVDVCARVGVA